MASARPCSRITPIDGRRAVKEYLQRVRAASQRMGQLLDDLLRLSSLKQAELSSEPVDLSKLAMKIASQLDETAPERLVEWSIQPAMMAKGDPELLRILLANLLGNAFKFTSKTAVAKIGLASSIAMARIYLAFATMGLASTWSMPTTLRRVRADRRTRLVPNVIFTSSTNERDLTAGYGYGADRYVAKPIDSAQFASVLSDRGRYWLSVNQQPDGPSHRRS